MFGAGLFCSVCFAEMHTNHIKWSFVLRLTAAARAFRRAHTHAKLCCLGAPAAETSVLFSLKSVIFLSRLEGNLPIDVTGRDHPSFIQLRWRKRWTEIRCLNSRHFQGKFMAWRFRKSSSGMAIFDRLLIPPTPIYWLWFCLTTKAGSEYLLYVLRLINSPMFWTHAFINTVVMNAVSYK